MLESVRNFLSGKRVIVIACILAIPFVFLGSTSFGTTFSSYGTVNGEPVTQIDINLATSQVAQRLQSIYGEEFSLEDLDEETTLNLIKNEIIIINQNQSEVFEVSKIPSWIRTITSWWINGEINDETFVKSLEFLVQKNIILI